MKIYKIAFILLLSVTLASCVFAEEVGKVVAVNGRVDMFKGNTGNAVPLLENDMVSTGDSIRTKSDSKAEIVFKDKSVLRIAQNSKVLIKDYKLDEKNVRKSASVELSRGKLRAIIAKMGSPADFVVTTPNAKGSVKGSDITALFQAGSSGMFVDEGKMAVINLAHPDKSITVPAGSACLIPEQELPKGPRPYMDVEKKSNEEDTNVPVPLSRTGKVSVIKGMVSKTSGQVRIINKGSDTARDAKISDIVGEGDRVETGNNGTVEIRLDNNNSIYLKPNTKLSIVTLLLNPVTGEFENIFEVTLGNVKARIEGLKGKSKFEVKTPTALCGARGTIIYVTVTQTGTISFFEGGNGYMTNTLSNVTQNVGAGQSSRSDYNGTVTIPIYVSDNQRQSYGEGWDGAAGIEGYSASGVEEGLEYLGGDTINGDVSINAQAIEQDLGYYLTEIPITEVINNLLNPNTQATNFLCRFGEVTVDRDGRTVVESNMDSFVDGYFMFSLPSTPEWKGNSNYSYVVGTYSNPDNKTFWTGDIEATASDGGTYKGWIGGRFLDSDGENKVDGKVFCIYVDPDGNGGTFSSYFSDGVYGAGVFTAASDSVDFIKRKASLGLSPQDLFTATMDEARLEAAGSGSFSSYGENIGSIECSSLGGTGLSLLNEKWGIWHIEAKGTYYGEISNDWSLALGGKVTGTLEEDPDNNYTCWLGTMTSSEKKSSQWEKGGIANAFKGVYLEKNNDTGFIRAGKIEDGDIMGYYAPDNMYEGMSYGGNWQVIGGGEWVEVTQLLNENDLNFTYDQLKDFISVPITEACPAIMMSGAGTGGIGNVYMNMNMYTSPSYPINIWTANISGSYTTNPASDEFWTANVANGNNVVDFTNGTWKDGQWTAKVSGTVNNSSVNGQAGGTYADGTFSGVGAGTWGENTTIQ